MIAVELLREAWFDGLSMRCRDLLRQSVYLLDRERGFGQDDMVISYGFLVFPAAKAFEGFLKDYFLAMGFIQSNNYGDEHFRIGRSLNPDLPHKYKNEIWLFDDVAAGCGQEVAMQLWETWKECRNHVFHFRDDTTEITSLDEAEVKITMILQAIKTASMCEARVHGLKKD